MPTPPLSGASSASAARPGAARVSLTEVAKNPAQFRRLLAQAPHDAIEQALVQTHGQTPGTHLENLALLAPDGTVRAHRLIPELESRGVTAQFVATLEGKLAVPADLAELPWRPDGERAELPPQGDTGAGPYLGRVRKALGASVIKTSDDLEAALFDVGQRLDLLTGSGSLSEQMFRVLDTLHRRGQLDPLLHLLGDVVNSSASAPLALAEPAVTGYEPSSRPVSTSAGVPAAPGLRARQLLEEVPQAGSSPTSTSPSRSEPLALETELESLLLTCFGSRLEMTLRMSEASSVVDEINWRQAGRGVANDLVYLLRKQPQLQAPVAKALAAENGRADLKEVLDEVVAVGLRPVVDSGPAPARASNLDLDTGDRAFAGGLGEFLQSAFGDASELRRLVRKLAPSAEAGVPDRGTVLDRIDHLIGYLLNHRDELPGFLSACRTERSRRGAEVDALEAMLKV